MPLILDLSTGALDWEGDDMYLSTFERGFEAFKLGLVASPYKWIGIRTKDHLAKHQAWWAGWNLAKAAAAIHRLDWE